MIWNPRGRDACRGRGARAAAARAAARDVVRWAASASPFYRERLGTATRPRARRSRRAAVHRARPICASTIRSGCWPCRATELARIHASSGTKGKPTVVGLHGRRSRRLARGDGAHDGGGRRAPRRPAAHRLRLRPLHRRARLPRRRRAHRHDGGAGLVRATPRATICCCRTSGRTASRHAVLRAAHRRDAGRAGRATRASSACATACSAPSRGPRACAPRSSGPSAARLRHLRAVARSSGPAWPASARPATGCTSPTITSCRRSSIPPPARRCRPGAKGELVLTTLTKRGDAAGPLPDRRHHHADPGAVRAAAGPRRGWRASRAGPTTC